MKTSRSRKMVLPGSMLKHSATYVLIILHSLGIEGATLGIRDQLSLGDSETQAPQLPIGKPPQAHSPEKNTAFKLSMRCCLAGVWPPCGWCVVTRVIMCAERLCLATSKALAAAKEDFRGAGKGKTYLNIASSSTWDPHTGIHLLTGDRISSELPTYKCAI